MHRFAEARQYLAQAETGDAPSDDVQALLLTIDQACGRNLDKVLDVRRHMANESNRVEDLVALGAVLADMDEVDDADKTYRRALSGYQDVSPFPLAWVYFQLGMLWGELAPERDQSRAAEWYRRAIEVLPGYTKARIHLAEICCSCRRLSEAEALLAAAVSSGDPEVRWRLADVTAAREKPCESEVHMEAARAGYDYLLTRHFLAFADHGAEFYAGGGKDFHRALHLTRANIANRPTLRAFEQGYTIAVCGGDNLAANEFLGEAAERWGATAGFRRSSLSRHRANGSKGAAA